MNYNFEWLNISTDGRVRGKHSFLSVNTKTGRFYINVKSMQMLKQNYNEKIKHIKVGIDIENKKLAIVPTKNDLYTISLYKGGSDTDTAKTSHSSELLDRIKTFLNYKEDNIWLPTEYNKEVGGLIVDLDNPI